MKYIAIHIFETEVGVEVTNAQNDAEACEELERNDANTIVFSEEEWNKVVETVQNILKTGCFDKIFTI